MYAYVARGHAMIDDMYIAIMGRELAYDRVLTL